MPKIKIILLLFLSLNISSCSNQKSENAEEVSTIIRNKNINEMIAQMELFHKQCEGQTILFRASGERTALADWDRIYPKKDVDNAIKILKPTLLTDAEIQEEKFGYLVLKKDGRKVVD